MAKKVSRVNKLKTEISGLQANVEYWQKAFKGEQQARIAAEEKAQQDIAISMLKAENFQLKCMNEYFRKMVEDLIFEDHEESKNGCGLTSCQTCS